MFDELEKRIVNGVLCQGGRLQHLQGHTVHPGLILVVDLLEQSAIRLQLQRGQAGRHAPSPFRSVSILYHKHAAEDNTNRKLRKIFPQSDKNCPKVPQVAVSKEKGMWYT